MRAVYEAVGYYPGISIAQTVNTLDLPTVCHRGRRVERVGLAPSLFRGMREHKYVYQLCEPLLKDIAEDNNHS
jgi:hypothetical protein